MPGHLLGNKIGEIVHFHWFGHCMIGPAITNACPVRRIFIKQKNDRNVHLIYQVLAHILFIEALHVGIR